MVMILSVDDWYESEKGLNYLPGWVSESVIGFAIAPLLVSILLLGHFQTLWQGTLETH